MVWFRRDRDEPRTWDLDALPPPWRDDDRRRTSIFAHVCTHLDPDGRVTEAGSTLPDEEEDRDRLRWVAGGLDGAFGHHGGGARAEDRAEAILRALRELLDDATAPRLAAFYEQVCEGSTLGYVDPFLRALGDADGLDVARLRALAVWLATRAPHREAVKLGIAILGGFADTEHRELLMTLGAHEEFTLYAAVALLHGRGEEAERDVFALAQRVEGWGRIQIVERLASTRDPEIKAWMLREGYRNAVMNEYLAYTCATAGGLRDALAVDHIDDALLRGAGAIIVALINGGPAENMDDYADGAEVVELYLRHLGPAPKQLRQLLVVDRIVDWLDDEENAEERAARGWTAERRERLRARCRELIALPHWPEQVRTDLLAEDRATFWVANRAAGVLGIDTWDLHFERLKADDATSWYEVMQTTDPARIERVVAFAEEHLDLEAIASGPSNALGFGHEWSQHSHLDMVLQDLERFPGKGWPLIRAGLRSPVIRNRNMALKALAAWERAAWPEDAPAVLERAVREEPEDDVKERMAKVLAGEREEEST